ncbi:MAG: retention module-containing protein, partial [Gammaproteobacteria bacterium]|nr:retention module-containing protein [Gammaproteobacteria bacterium]
MNNQTITEVSRVTFISGVAKVRTPDGEVHDLKVGDVLQPGTEVILADASVFVVEATAPEATGAQMPPEAVAAGDLPAGQQPASPEMGSADDQTLAQINQLQQAILAGADPTEAFEAAAAGVAADAGGRGPGSGNSGFISVDRIGDETIATAGYDTGAQGAAPVIQADEPAALIPEEENRPTLVAPDTNTVKEDTPATGNVLANDSDPDDALSVVSFVVNGETYTAGSKVVLPGIGTLVINADGSYVFDPNDNWNGTVPEVTYTTNTQASSTLNITVEPVNDIPVAVNDSNSVQEDATISVPLTGVLNNDTDIDGDTLAVTGIRTGTESGSGASGTVGNALTDTYGTLVLNANGSYSYVANQPAANALAQGQVATDIFTYTISDGHGGMDTAQLVITITGTNDAPVAMDDSNSVLEDAIVTTTALDGSVLINDTDADGD